MGKVIDLAGKKFGRLEVLSRDGTDTKRTRWNCICDCGTNKAILGGHLSSGKIQSCGCYHREMKDKANRKKFIDLTNKRFGRWLVISRAPDSKKARMWNCVCDCGKVKVLSGCSLKAGTSTSCGCLAAEIHTTHGMTNNKSYRAWHSMIQRCTNKNNSSYKNYGGREISICDRWLEKFENFYEDMGERPEGKTLDRRDNSKGYSPDNCRWATGSEQNYNKRPRGNKTGVTGVSVKRNRFVARITINYKVINLGSFKTLEEAKEARLKAELKYHGANSPTQ